MVALDTQEVFKVMQCAYRNGVLEKFMLLQGEVMPGVVEQTGLNMGDLINRLDEADEATVMKLDKLLDRAGPLVKYADSDLLMRLTSRMLDIALLRKLMKKTMQATMVRAVTGQKPPPMRERLRALVGRT